jgi:uncharacterized protein (TIGR02001 family)
MDDCRTPLPTRIPKTAAIASMVGASMLMVCLAPRSVAAADAVGGSLGFTSDYLVRGISRSDQQAAVQGDLHWVTDTGFLAGLFASSVRFDSSEPRSAEISPFVGYTWAVNDAWRVKGLVTYYGYLGSDTGSRYNYAEFSAEAAFEDWLDVAAEYSPDAPRVTPYGGLRSFAAGSAEVNLRSPPRHHLVADAGMGYSQVGGPDGGSYLYWSVGGLIDLPTLSVSLNYVNTNAQAAAFFYSQAAHDCWTATLIWRF